jgi:hypothetical protein
VSAARAALIALGAVATFAAAPGARADETPSFQRDVVPLLKFRCAACHLTGEEAGGMALHPRAAYATLVGVKSMESPLLRIKPGAPDESYLVHKIRGTQLDVGGSGLRMPADGEPLAAAEIQMIRDWITAGAKND